MITIIEYLCSKKIISHWVKNNNEGLAQKILFLLIFGVIIYLFSDFKVINFDNFGLGYE